MPEATDTTATIPTDAATTATVSAAVTATETTLLGDASATAATTTPATTPAVEPVTAEKPAEVKAPEVKVGAPEKYVFVAPEGTNYDANILSAFEASAKDADLPQDVAQKLLDSINTKHAVAQAEGFKALKAEWINATKTDPEFGGDALDANLAIANKALERFGDPILSKFLASTGFGNHPSVVRCFHKIGLAISEDKFVGGAARTSTSNPLDVLYPTTRAKE